MTAGTLTAVEQVLVEVLVSALLREMRSEALAPRIISESRRPPEITA